MAPGRFLRHQRSPQSPRVITLPNPPEWLAISAAEVKTCGRVFRKLAPPVRRRMSRDQRIIIVPGNILAQIVGDWTDTIDHHDVANGRASRQDVGRAWSEASTMTTQSAARLMTYSRSASNSRRLSVWPAAPIPMISYQLFEMLTAVQCHGRITRHDAERQERRAATRPRRRRSSDPSGRRLTTSR